MKIVIMIFLFCALLVIPQFQTDAEAAEQYACVKKNNGQFRLVDHPDDCNPSEYPVKFDVKDNGDLEGEMCWTNADCTLILNLSSAGALFSFFGRESCVDEEKHVYGNGFRISNENSDELKIGLTFIGAESHEHKVLVMNVDNGFDLCGANGDSCEPPAYNAEDCDETE